MPLMPLSILVTCAIAPDCRFDAVHVADAVLVGHKEEIPAVRCPLRVDVLPLAEGRERRDAARRHVEQRQPIVAGVEQGSVRGEAVGDKRDRVSVWRPCRLKIRVEVARNSLDGARGRCALRNSEVVDKEVGIAAHGCRERNGLSVGRPRRVEDLSDLRHFNFPGDVGVCDIQDREHGLAGVHAADDELAAVRAPRSRRVDELQAREMGVLRGVDELADDAAGRCFRKIEIDREQIARREKDDVLPVRADRWRYIRRHARLV